MRWQVFIGIFLGYAGYYLVRKNFSLVMPDLVKLGYSNPIWAWLYQQEVSLMA
jgi:OPA family glycerol-3-phosphate transporter-like MFS transporter